MSQSQKRKASESSKKRQARRQAGKVVQAPIARVEEQDWLALQRALANPTAATSADALALQRRYGNWVVQRLLARDQDSARGFDLEDEMSYRTSWAQRDGQTPESAVQERRGAHMEAERPASHSLERKVQGLARQEVATERVASLDKLTRPMSASGVIQRGLWGDIKRKIRALWAGISVDNSAIPGCSIWYPRDGAQNLAISSHGGDAEVQPVSVRDFPFAVAYICQAHEATDRQLSNLGATQEHLAAHSTVRNYAMTKYQGSGGGEETYQDICRYVHSNPGWAVLTVHAGRQLTYAMLKQYRARLEALGVDTIYALHCRGQVEQPHMMAGRIPLPGMRR